MFGAIAGECLEILNFFSQTGGIPLLLPSYKVVFPGNNHGSGV